MTYPLSRRTLGAALALAAFGSVPVVAQETIETREETGERSDPRRKSDSANRAEATAPDSVPWLVDTITVTAKGTAADWPTTLATEVLSYDEAIASPSDFQDWIIRVPGVGATGQNGLFETFSIRGSGGNGILVLAAGVPITAQRRAGVPVAFVEPYLLGEVNVTRGPAVVHFGAGALGGAVSLEPRWFIAPFVAGGYATAGGETTLAAGTGSDDFSLGAARHRAGDSNAPDGTPLNTGFERSSATLQARHRSGKFVFDALLIPSRTENIGKSNIRFPDRQVTTYPEDEHTIGRLRLRHDNGFEASAYAHDQKLSTFKQTPDRDDAYAFIGSRDGGLTVQRSWESGDFSNDLGVEYFGRRDVQGYDAKGNPADRNYSLKDAREDNRSLFAITNWQVAPEFALELGGRATTNEQQQAGAISRDSDAAFTAGAVYMPRVNTRWTVNLSSGYRFATLEERFFTGVTGRGEIVANPNLGSEHSLGADIGFAWYAGDWNTEIHVWRTNVDDLIQKVEIDPDVEGYVNVGHAKLHGADATLGWAATDSLFFNASSSLVLGEDNTGQPLYGIPPLRASLQATWDIGVVSLSGLFTHRWRKSRPGYEELEREAVDIVAAQASYHARAGLDLQIYVRNALDKSYYATSDELSAFAPERSVGFNVIWTAN